VNPYDSKRLSLVDVVTAYESGQRSSGRGKLLDHYRYLKNELWEDGILLLSEVQQRKRKRKLGAGHKNADVSDVDASDEGNSEYTILFVCGCERDDY